MAVGKSGRGVDDCEYFNYQSIKMRVDIYISYYVFLVFPIC